MDRHVLSDRLRQARFACGELFDERYPVWAEIAVISSRQDVPNALIGPSLDLWSTTEKSSDSAT